MLFSALTACNFFLRRQEKVTKKKATPALRGRLRRLPCATREAGRLRNSGLCPSDSPRRLLPAALRCSALHEGGGKAHRTEPDAPYGRYSIGSQLALCVVEQHKTRRGKGRGLFEDRRSVFRSPPLRLSSAETPAQPGDAVGATSFWLLFLGKTRKSTPAGKAEQSRSSPITPEDSRSVTCSPICSEKPLPRTIIERFPTFRKAADRLYPLQIREV